MAAADSSFQLMTSLVYRADSPADPFPLLARHFARLRRAHAALARERPDCWCASRSMPDDEAMLAALQGAVKRAQSEGMKEDLRIRLTVTEDGQPKVEAFPLAPMPSYPVRLVLDDRPTSYSDPFLRYKTTQRQVYDDARARHGATLHPSEDSADSPFDTVLFNPALEITETTISNIAFRFRSAEGKPFITPRTECGLLEGVMRAELLERGELVEGVVTLTEVKEATEVRNLLLMASRAYIAS
ncbi:D-aminoacid aminotransferase-like PLP-dependent enzyme [Rhodotorula sp. JG-1b]|nr:D-aminoacid aminotransferase-like PLP-dependent enzyme [Rhodotorula sp. JG-1b]